MYGHGNVSLRLASVALALIWEDWLKQATEPSGNSTGHASQLTIYNTQWRSLITTLHTHTRRLPHPAPIRLA